MEYNEFKEWLQDEKDMSIRSATDVVSRCRRVNKLTRDDTITEKTTTVLIEIEEYNDMSSFVKSQLKRAVSLYLEYAKGVANYRK